MKKITLSLLLSSLVMMAQAVTPPDGLDQVIYSFNGYDTYIKQEKQTEVFIVFDNSEVYIKGLSVDYLPDGWVKGDLTDGVLTIDEAYMGAFDFWGDTYELYFDGAQFTYDAATGVFFSADGYTTTAEETVLDEYVNVTLTPVSAPAATPAQPTITEFTEDQYGHYVKMEIPLLDVDGNKLLGSLMNYRLYYEVGDEVMPFVFTTDDYLFIAEDMDEIPYNFTDSYDIDKAGKQVYLYSDDIEQWTAIGVQSVYTGGEERNESEVFWLPLVAVGIGNVAAESPAVETRLYNLQGAEVRGDNARGVLLRVTRRADGTLSTDKVIR